MEYQATTAAFLARGLQEEGLMTEVAYNGQDGLRLLLTGEYELAILDVVLPGLDGWSVLEAAQRAQCQTPVMFLTACDDIDDRVRGLDLGAEDYLVKPFAFGELLARIRVILRRRDRYPADAAQTIFQIADLSIDLLKHRAVRSGERLDLTPKEFSLLSLMMRRAGEVQSRTAILDQVWNMHFDSGTNVVEVAMRRLRSKLDDPYPVKLLHTVRGVGYVLEARE